MSTLVTPKRFRILIIDDNHFIHEDIRKILPSGEARDSAFSDAKRRILGRADTPVLPVQFDIDSAYQGEEGLQKVQEADREGRPYALAFVDVRMPPGMDGIETIERLWQSSPDVQIVLCTAYSDHSWEEIVPRLRKPDAIVILKKPFDNIEVLQLAYALTTKWRLELEMRRHVEDLDRLIQERTGELSSTNEQLRTEIMKRASTEEALRHSEERFSKAFVASPVPMAIQSLRSGLFVDVNHRFQDLTGYSRAELIGHSSEDLRLLSTVGTGDPDAEDAPEPGLAFDLPFQLNIRGEGPREVLVSLGQFEMQGESFQLTLIQDVTEQKALEAQLRQVQKMEAVGQLAAGVAHDFNNLLQVILGNSELLLRKISSDANHQEPIRRITDATNRATRLVQQLMTYSRKTRFNKEMLDVRDCLASIAEMLPRLIPESIEISITVDADLPLIFADPGMIDQILVNLAVNARDAMPNGGLLTIHAGEAATETPQPGLAPQEAGPQRLVCIRVADTGCGMSPEVQARIFEPFFTTKAVGKGTGLGLSTVYGIAQEHGGWVEVESQPGHGSEFRLYLPARDAAALADPVTASSDSNLEGHETVLVVEDEQWLRKFLVTVLNMHGYRTLDAASGPEALELWAAHRGEIQLLLTDMVVPGGLTGRQLAERLSLEDPSLKVLFSSGYDPGATDQALAEQRDHAFIAKPYTTAKLLRKLREVMGVPGEMAPGSR